ncbi:putative multi-domain containing protein [Aduncisulcus paluster]|uniref:Multi-domain containing protein n=1 Tax=Aduncisulcus paluster TaxID=2918883 RepID=A0ABQ5K348_9EUKA|nr:putative multi-domain containing protein [Aduncisulcus paluster]
MSDHTPKSLGEMVSTPIAHSASPADSSPPESQSTALNLKPIGSLATMSSLRKSSMSRFRSRHNTNSSNSDISPSKPWSQSLPSPRRATVPSRRPPLRASHSHSFADEEASSPVLASDVFKYSQQPRRHSYQERGGNHKKSKWKSIRVVCRVRPMLPKELAEGEKASCDVEDHKVRAMDPHGKATLYRFASALPPGAGQESVYDAVLLDDIVDHVIHGYGACMLAYGQTGSGKSHTMIGPDGGIEIPSPSDNNAGVIPRTIHKLFTQTKSLTLSFCEVYNEQVFDLLHEIRMTIEKMKGIIHKDVAAGLAKPLKIKWDRDDGFYVDDLTTVTVTSAEEAIQVLQIGTSARKVASHDLNRASSRSHGILDIKLGNGGRLMFGDLAGSERLKASKVSGIHAKETGHINKSLFILGTVINALSSSSSNKLSLISSRIRETVLTKLLGATLTGNSITCLVACVNPCLRQGAETLRTLDYASTAQNIRTKPILRSVTGKSRDSAGEEGSQGFERAAKLQSEVAALQLQLRAYRRQIQKLGGVPQEPSGLLNKIMRKSEDLLVQEMQRKVKKPVDVLAQIREKDSSSGSGRGGEGDEYDDDPKLMSSHPQRVTTQPRRIPLKDRGKFLGPESPPATSMKGSLASSMDYFTSPMSSSASGGGGRGGSFRSSSVASPMKTPRSSRHQKMTSPHSSSVVSQGSRSTTRRRAVPSSPGEFSDISELSESRGSSRDSKQSRGGRRMGLDSTHFHADALERVQMENVVLTHALEDLKEQLSTLTQGSPNRIGHAFSTGEMSSIGGPFTSSAYEPSGIGGSEGYDMRTRRKRRKMRKPVSSFSSFKPRSSSSDALSVSHSFHPPRRATVHYGA